VIGTREGRSREKLSDPSTGTATPRTWRRIFKSMAAEPLHGPYQAAKPDRRLSDLLAAR